MKTIICQQGSPEWLAARAGAITASRFSDALSTLKNGQPSAKAGTYLCQVAIERVSGKPCDEAFNSWQMQRGAELEGMARLKYEAFSGNIVEEAGVVKTDDDCFGYSTDGFIDDDGMAEIKCLVSAPAIIDMWTTADMAEFMHQMQGGMWLTGRKWCDFIMYCPQLEAIGKALFVRRVLRDEAFIEDMEARLIACNRRVDELVTLLKAA
jgi:YqaJ-like viral recombinase domain